MKTLLLFFFLIIILASCGAAKTSITFVNLSGNLIDSLKVSSYGLNLKFVNLKQGDTLTHYAEIDVKGDGSFLTLLYVKDSMVKSTQFGYFSTKSDIKPRYTIKIDKNLTITEQ